MEEVNLTDTESRYFGDLFLCCETEKSNKVPILKATEMFRSANLSNDVLRQITSLAGIPQTAIHMSRAQFYSCLKLIAAHQASVPLREELISSTISLPLPKFSWKDTSDSGGQSSSSSSLNSIEKRNDLQWRQSAVLDLNNEPQADMCNSDFPSTDSEIEHNDVEVQDRSHRHKRSPEAWSTASDSPTPTNSVAERSWTKNNLWDGLLCEEQRELLGTEEESSDRHSSDDDDGDPVLEVLETPETLETLYQITSEQRTYYVNQFKTVQPDINGLISGQVAKVFFEKSRIPVKELRHIWQLCDITRDGALNLNEFIAAMHLIVLRRNCIPVPPVLPQLLKQSIPLGTVTEPPEADLLHLDDDKTICHTTIPTATTNRNDFKSMSFGSDVSDGPMYKSHSSVSSLPGGQQVNPKLPSPVKLSSASTSTTASTTQQRKVNSSPQSSGTPPAEHMSPVKLKDTEWSNQNKEWTKFTESPTSNLSSPGPKPVNFDMQRTAQAVGSDPQILHPVPLRVTPSAVDAIDDEPSSRPDFHKKSDSGLQEPGTIFEYGGSKQVNQYRESLQNDLRAIQRPQSKKLPTKSVGGLPPPPQREPSIGSSETGSSSDATSNNVIGKKEPQPPPPPPRPHKHARSSSLDLNKFKLNEEHRTGAPTSNHLSSTMSAASTSSNRITSPTAASTTVQDQAGPIPVASSTQIYDGAGTSTAAQSHDPSATPPRHTIQFVHQTQTTRSSAFEVYRKPASTSFYSPEPTTSGSALSSTESDHLVTALTDSLRNTKSKQERNLFEVMHQLKEQNALLLRLCYDLSEELKSVKQKKEEIISQLEASSGHHHSTV